MPKTKNEIIMPTPAEDATITAAVLADPDAVPFTDAEWAKVKPLVGHGLPLGSGTSFAFNAAPFAHMDQHEATWNTAAVHLGLDSQIEQRREWIARGWPDKLSYGMVARLQHPSEPAREKAMRFGLMRDCIQNKIPHHRPPTLVIVQGKLWTRDPIQTMYLNPVPEEGKQHAFKIVWNVVRDWLAQRRIEPSEHLTAWFAANDAQSSFRMGNASTDATPPAPGANSASNAPACDFSMLATRAQLIDAFGSFTGMDASWFNNLKDTPALLTARKVAGQGGRAHITEPWFCPFEVMQWLADSKRRKGRKLSAEKAWTLLEKNFPKVFNARSVADPRAGD